MKRRLARMAKITIIMALLAIIFSLLPRPAGAVSEGCAQLASYIDTLQPATARLTTLEFAAGEIIIIDAQGGGRLQIDSPAGTPAAGPIDAPATLYYVIPASGQRDLQIMNVSPDQPLTITLRCDGAAAERLLAAGIPDMPIALGSIVEADGRPALTIYRVADESKEPPLLTIYPEDLAALRASLTPLEDTLLLQIEDVMILARAGGDFAVQIGPDSVGIVRGIVFDNVPPNVMYGYVVRVNGG
jgi:hypothetical protein